MLRAGTVAESVLLLIDGRVRLAGVTPQGEEVLLRWFVPGEFVGLASFLGRVPFAGEALAAGDLEAIQLDAEALRRHLETDVEGALAFARIVSTFACELMELFVTFTAGRLEARIVGLLQRLASHEPSTGDRQEVRLMVSQQDIADAVGASRQRVSVELRKLEEDGCLQLGYRHIVLLRRLQ